MQGVKTVCLHPRGGWEAEVDGKPVKGLEGLKDVRDAAVVVH